MNSTTIPNFHILKVTYVGATNFKPSRVKITSDRFKQSVIITYDHSCDNTFEIAANWLLEKGFAIVGKGEIKNAYAVISTTFEPLKTK